MYRSLKDEDDTNDGSEDGIELLRHDSLPQSSWNSWFFRTKRRDDWEISQSSRKSLSQTSILLLTANLVLFISSIVMICLSTANTRSISNNRHNRLLKLTSTYSPIFDQIPISLQTIHTNGSFWPQSPPSLYQLPPSPSVDAAWDRLADTHALALTATDLHALGKDPSTTYPWPSSYSIPNHPPNEKTYMALPNVFHQIHCLNLFRKLASPDYYGEFWTHSPSFPFSEHVGHCQYMLLQALTCHADMEMITFGKVKGTPGPFPDFGVDMVCRDWEAILKWKERNQVDVEEEEWGKIQVMPEGIVELDPIGRTVAPGRIL